MRTVLLTALIVVAAASAHSTAQHQLQPVAALRGAPALELALRKLDTVGSFMMTTAHPDDENNSMLAYFGHGQGYRTSLVTATHGEGGQNEIGPELFVPLAVLRTEELLAAHRFDGAEQYFTRAIDFGYSFSIDETLEKWGHQEILGDFVRMIRTIRPDVVVGFVFDGDGGGQHHQTSSRLTLEAFRAAADPAKFPEQIADGLRPWQAKKFYATAGFGVAAPTTLRFTGGDVFDPVLGRTYNEIGGEARSMHKCQGMSQLLPLPAPTGGGGGFGGPGGERAYRLRDSVLEGGVARPETEIFDGVDTSLRSLASLAPAATADLGTRLDRISALVAEARQALAAGGTAAAAAPIARGLEAVRDVRGSLAPLDANARFEIDFRLAQKEEQFAEALLLAADVRLEAIARDGLVPAGQPLAVQLMAAKRGAIPVTVSTEINGLTALKPEEARACSGEVGAAAGHVSCARAMAVPAGARLTAAHFHLPAAGAEAPALQARTAPAVQSARYVFDADVPFGLPFRPTPFTATFNLTVGGTQVERTIPIQARTEGNIFSGEKRHEIHVVPAFAVTTTPDVVVVATSDPQPKDVRVTVTNHASGAAAADVTLQLPQGWRATPATQPVRFTREDESITVRFSLQPPAAAALAAAAIAPQGNRYAVTAVVTSGGRTFQQGYQVVEYPHTTRRHVLVDPRVTVKALDVRVKPNVSVGYVMGVGDEVPAALEQLGVRLSMISPDELAWGDLARYDVVMTGVRAYERRADLRAYNQRLLEYAKAGGTVIVQYNKFEFNEAQYGPYPARVGRNRVTDENAELRLLAPSHPVFNEPNAIGRADWADWVQERGLYFLDQAGRDSPYTDLIEFTDPFPNNPGAKRGALVEAKVGEGRWIYVGLGLWRQLPAGTDGAFRLMANLLSLP